MGDARYTKETYKAYKERLKAEKAEEKRYLRGRFVWLGTMGTMGKDKNDKMYIRNPCKSI